ncbi:MAG: hypothetical protein IKE69_11500 [Thermoguttaceae bacterium]|nr:hypothetical protein [Thermoguttaceae bacterium]
MNVEKTPLNRAVREIGRLKIVLSDDTPEWHALLAVGWAAVKALENIGRELGAFNRKFGEIVRERDRTLDDALIELAQILNALAVMQVRNETERRRVAEQLGAIGETLNRLLAYFAGPAEDKEKEQSE